MNYKYFIYILQIFAFGLIFVAVLRLPSIIDLILMFTSLSIELLVFGKSI